MAHREAFECRSANTGEGGVAGERPAETADDIDDLTPEQEELLGIAWQQIAQAEGMSEEELLASLDAAE